MRWIPRNRWKQKEIQDQLGKLLRKKIILYQDPFFTLPGHEHYRVKRITRREISKKKWEKARRGAWLFGRIPTVSLVGVTGGLAVSNTDKKDDIDYYIGVVPGTLWISRLLCVVAAELVNNRRRPKETRVQDMFCLNMFAAEDHFTVPKKEQDLFTAHEVLQMRPLWCRAYAYRKFLQQNHWVKTFFSAYWKELYKKNLIPKETEKHIWMIRILQILDKPAKYIQLWYMRKKRTTESISDTVVRFHPHDVRVWIWKRIEKNMKQYHLPLDKEFFYP